MSQEAALYQFTKIDYTHPDPAYRSGRHVSVHIDVAGEELVAGATVEVA